MSKAVITSRLFWIYPAPEGRDQAVLIYQKKFWNQSKRWKGSHFHMILYKDGCFERGQWSGRTIIDPRYCGWHSDGIHFRLNCLGTSACRKDINDRSNDTYLYNLSHCAGSGEMRFVKPPYMAPIPGSISAFAFDNVINQITREYDNKKWDGKVLKGHKLADRNAPTVIGKVAFAAEGGVLYKDGETALDLTHACYERIEPPYATVDVKTDNAPRPPPPPPYRSSDSYANRLYQHNIKAHPLCHFA